MECGSKFLLGRCCYRGNLYCGIDCRARARKRSLDASRKRCNEAAAADEEIARARKKAHREGQNRYRQRKRLSEEVQKRNVTDHTPQAHDGATRIPMTEEEYRDPPTTPEPQDGEGLEHEHATGAQRQLHVCTDDNYMCASQFGS